MSCPGCILNVTLGTITVLSTNFTEGTIKRHLEQRFFLLFLDNLAFLTLQDKYNKQHTWYLSLSWWAAQAAYLMLLCFSLLWLPLADHTAKLLEVWNIFFMVYGVQYSTNTLGFLLWFRFTVFNANFKNISVILWLSVLLVEETGGPRENRWPEWQH
jgi:hypothetical protein